MTWEVYGSGVGFLGYVTALTEEGAKRVARKLWREVPCFAVSLI